MGNANSIVATRANLRAEAKGKKVILVDTAAGKLQMKEHTVIKEHVDQVNCVAMSPKGILASSGNDGEIMLFDTKNQKPLALRSDQSNLVYALCFSPNDEGRHVITASFDKSVRIFNIAAFSHPAPDADEKSKSSKKVCQLLAHRQAIGSIAYSPNAQYLATGSEDSSVIIWDMPKVMKTKERQFVHTLPHPGPVYAVAFSSDSRRVYTACKDRGIRCFVCESGQELWDEPLISSKAPIGAGGAGGRRGSIASDKINLPLTLSASPDGTMLACGSQDKTITIFDIATDPKVPNLKFDPLTGHTAPVRSVQFSNNSSFLVSGSEDATIRVFKVLNGEENDEGIPSVTLVAGPILAGTDRINSVAWSPDNNFVVSASYDSTVRVFTFDCPGVQMGTFTADRDIPAVEFSKDGNMIIARDAEGGIIKTWYTSPRAEKRAIAKATKQMAEKKAKEKKEQEDKNKENNSPDDDVKDSMEDSKTYEVAEDALDGWGDDENYDNDPDYESTDSEEEERLAEEARRNTKMFRAAGTRGQGFVGEELREECAVDNLDSSMASLGATSRKKKELAIEDDEWG